MSQMVAAQSPGSPASEGDLTARQQARLAWIEKTHPYLYRPWLLKESIRVIFQLKGQPREKQQ
jgi:hypothetical protein